MHFIIKQFPGFIYTSKPTMKREYFLVQYVLIHIEHIIFSFTASPKIDSHDNNKNMVQGDVLELKCKVSGYPIPSVSWFKDDKEVETTTRIHTLEYEGAMGKLMIYSLEDEDEGIYKCVAENDVAPFNSTAQMRVRVKGKNEFCVNPYPAGTESD